MGSAFVFLIVGGTKVLESHFASNSDFLYYPCLSIYWLSITPYRPLPSRSDITYFGAGLPTEIIEDEAQALINYQSTDLGIVEHSHRSAIATNIINETKAIWRPTLIPRTITR